MIDSILAHWNCGYSRDGLPPSEPFASERPAQSQESEGASQDDAPESQSTDYGSVVVKRYADAYLRAQAAIDIGRIVKGFGIVLGMAILVVSLAVKADGG